jgi:predicted nucleic acid-binding protein
VAPASGAEAGPVEERLVRVFCDADVLIAGAASTRGASHILLQLSEFTLIDCVSSPAAIAEAERNIAAKLPAASSTFRKILAAAIDAVPEATSSFAHNLAGQAHPKDLPILAAAVASGADFFTTFNVRHYHKRAAAPLVVQPRRVVAAIRLLLGRLSTEAL